MARDKEGNKLQKCCSQEQSRFVVCSPMHRPSSDGTGEISLFSRFRRRSQVMSTTSPRLRRRLLDRSKLSSDASAAHGRSDKSDRELKLNTNVCHHRHEGIYTGSNIDFSSCSRWERSVDPNSWIACPGKRRRSDLRYGKPKVQCAMILAVDRECMSTSTMYSSTKCIFNKAHTSPAHVHPLSVQQTALKYAGKRTQNAHLETTASEDGTGNLAQTIGR